MRTDFGVILSAGMAKKSTLSKHLSELGKKGGKARVEKMTPQQRSESARKAAQARWASRKKQSDR